MPLRDMTAEQCRQALCDLAPPLCAILQDSRFSALLARLTEPDLPLADLTALLLGEGVPLLLREHAADTAAVLAILTNQRREDLSALPLSALLPMLRKVWDEDLSDFFACAGASRPTPSSGRSSARRQD